MEIEVDESLEEARFSKSSTRGEESSKGLGRGFFGWLRRLKSSTNKWARFIRANDLGGSWFQERTWPMSESRWVSWRSVMMIFENRLVLVDFCAFELRMEGKIRVLGWVRTHLSYWESKFGPALFANQDWEVFSAKFLIFLDFKVFFFRWAQNRDQKVFLNSIPTQQAWEVSQRLSCCRLLLNLAQRVNFLRS